MSDLERYHRRFKRSRRAPTLAYKVPAYARALDELGVRPGVVVLGGFASSRSLDDFKNFAERAFPQAQLTALDISPDPFKEATPDSKVQLLRADVARLPF